MLESEVPAVALARDADEEVDEADPDTTTTVVRAEVEKAVSASEVVSWATIVERAEVYRENRFERGQSPFSRSRPREDDRRLTVVVEVVEGVVVARTKMNEEEKGQLSSF